MVTDNGTPFVNKQVSSTLSGYDIKHRRSTPYYPQGNGQAEATNKTILSILSKMVFHLTHLCTGLRLFHPWKSPSRQPEYQLLITWNGIQSHARIGACWASKFWMKKRAEAERRTSLYNKTVAQAYNMTVKPRSFKQGDLVLKVVEHVRRQVSRHSKFDPQWEGPFTVKEAYSSGYYRLVSVK
ncbi:unnamed protein product [Prunus armeniaca]